jgi:hypothetical protein
MNREGVEQQSQGRRLGEDIDDFHTNRVLAAFLVRVAGVAPLPAPSSPLCSSRGQK